MIELRGHAADGAEVSRQEFIQIGSCGSPILTDAGWLLFTHGVGAMRKYSLGAALLDRDNPAR